MKTSSSVMENMIWVTLCGLREDEKWTSDLSKVNRSSSTTMSLCSTTTRHHVLNILTACLLTFVQNSSLWDWVKLTWLSQTPRGGVSVWQPGCFGPITWQVRRVHWTVHSRQSSWSKGFSLGWRSRTEGGGDLFKNRGDGSWGVGCFLFFWVDSPSGQQITRSLCRNRPQPGKDSGLFHLNHKPGGDGQNSSYFSSDKLLYIYYIR